jgi:hypothetical protein
MARAAQQGRYVPMTNVSAKKIKETIEGGRTVVLARGFSPNFDYDKGLPELFAMLEQLRTARVEPAKEFDEATIEALKAARSAGDEAAIEAAKAALVEQESKDYISVFCAPF